jgi:hypothetical protein
VGELTLVVKNIASKLRRRKNAATAGGAEGRDGGSSRGGGNKGGAADDTTKEEGDGKKRRRRRRPRVAAPNKSSTVRSSILARHRLLALENDAKAVAGAERGFAERNPRVYMPVLYGENLVSWMVRCSHSAGIVVVAAAAAAGGGAGILWLSPLHCGWARAAAQQWF